jgi:hypothetical protein
MDHFKKAQLHEIGIGGLGCPCCNNKGRKKGGTKVDKALAGQARTRIKAQTKKEIDENI